MVSASRGTTTAVLGVARQDRNNIDGAVGVDPVLSSTIDGGDDDYWANFRRRVTGEMSREEWISYAKSRPS